MRSRFFSFNMFLQRYSNIHAKYLIFMHLLQLANYFNSEQNIFRKETFKKHFHRINGILEFDKEPQFHIIRIELVCVHKDMHTQYANTLPSWCQFHQQFTSDFFANIFSPKNYKAKCYQRKAAQFAFVRKTLR